MKSLLFSQISFLVSGLFAQIFFKLKTTYIYIHNYAVFLKFILSLSP